MASILREISHFKWSTQLPVLSALRPIVLPLNAIRGLQQHHRHHHHHQVCQRMYTSTMVLVRKGPTELTAKKVRLVSSIAGNEPRVIPAQFGPLFKKSPFSMLRESHTIDTLISDMNGTLFDPTEIHRLWAAVMREKFLEYCGEEHVNQFFDAVKYDTEKGVADGEGMLAMRPWNDIYDTAAYELSRATGMEYAEASLEVANWRGSVDHMNGHKAIVDVEALFDKCIENGIKKFAISTAEDRPVVVKLLEEANVLDKVDIIVAGTDPIAPKPQIDNVRYIFRSLESLPQNTVLMGDTKADMLLGRIGDIAMRVGVLSGRGTVEQLQLYTDIFIERADKICSVIRGDLTSDIIHVTYMSTGDDANAPPSISYAP
eukprot:m.4870 g.4870  ORF g.4870 m.4870 type:complete len:373 (+) comp2305_c0_seq1:430-1548(+)